MEYKDKVFVNKVVELYQLVYMNDLIFLIDMENIILFAGQKIQELANIKADELTGKNYLGSLPLPQENLKNIIASMDKVVQTRAKAEFISINLNHNKDYIGLQCIQKPVINPETNNIVAVSVESYDLDLPIDFYKLFMLARIDLSTIKNIPNNKMQHVDELLTLREHEVAFSYLYCKTADKVAQLLRLLHGKPVSLKTIHNIIRQQLYPKFGVHNLDALREKLNLFGYHKRIPVSFLVNLHFDLSLI